MNPYGASSTSCRRRLSYPTGAWHV
ncbi:hypothetical protein [Cohnella sp. GCM10012308]